MDPIVTIVPAKCPSVWYKCVANEVILRPCDTASVLAGVELIQGRKLKKCKGFRKPNFELRPGCKKTLNLLFI